MKKFIPVLLVCLLLLAACGDATQTDAADSPASGLNIFDGGGLTDRYIDPLTTGKVTVLNFWGTWCPYCLYEMPHLDQIAGEYADRLVVIAAHTDLSYSYASAEDPIEYVAENYPSSHITFVNDAGNQLYATMGGSRGYPYTVILDGSGTVLSSFYGYQDYESWVSIVENALNG